MKNLESGSLSYATVGVFLSDLKEEFGEGDNEMIKMAELKKVEQGSKTMKEFVQEFGRVAKRSGYKRQPLIEEFKRGVNGVIRRKLIEIKRPPRSIDKWYKCTTNLDRHWGES